MSQSYQHRNHSVSLLNYHFVWIPKRRRKVLVNAVATKAEELIREKSAELGCEVIAIEIMPDHVHLFLNCPPDLAPKQIMFRLKGYSARILRKEFSHLRRMPSMWTSSYFVSTAGNVSSATIKRYIEEQKSH